MCEAICSADTRQRRNQWGLGRGERTCLYGQRVNTLRSTFIGRGKKPLNVSVCEKHASLLLHKSTQLPQSTSYQFLHIYIGSWRLVFYRPVHFVKSQTIIWLYKSTFNTSSDYIRVFQTYFYWVKYSVIFVEYDLTCQLVSISVVQVEVANIYLWCQPRNILKCLPAPAAVMLNNHRHHLEAWDKNCIINIIG